MSPPHSGASSGAGMGGGGGRRSSGSSSPEFEFWMVRNPSSPQPRLLPADELFVDGVILPLHLLRRQPADATDPPLPPGSCPAPEATPKPSAAADSAPGPPPAGAPSKRWRRIFRAAAGGDRGAADERARRRERKGGAGAAAELNINIWPFSRSRSAGTGGSRPKSSAAAATSATPWRRANSAPVSRSNSRGEPSSSKPPPSAGAGFRVGRIGPVWRARRGPPKKSGSQVDDGKGGSGGGAGVGAKVPNGQEAEASQASRRPGTGGDDKNSTAEEGGGRTPISHNGAVNGIHFNLKTFFSKKV